MALEEISPGQEIRFDYERGEHGTYWHGARPAETNWRTVRLEPPPASNGAQSEPARALCVLSAIQRAKERTVDGNTKGGLDALLEDAIERTTREPPKPFDWSSSPSGGDVDGVGGISGDTRLLHLAALLREERSRCWPLVSTHLPGRTAAECQQRLESLQCSMAKEAAAAAGRGGGALSLFARVAR